MVRQGRSLGRQLSVFVPPLVELIRGVEGRVWFLGRDCDVFAEAFRLFFPNVRYLVGLNRDNARKLQHRRRLCKWLLSIGVRPGDVLVDSGYRGSIYERILRDGGSQLRLRMVLLTAHPEGYVGEPLMEASVCPSGRPPRSVILALEHSPKREVVSWDPERRVPVVRKVSDRRPYEFFDGCVEELRKAIRSELGRCKRDVS